MSLLGACSCEILGFTLVKKTLEMMIFLLIHSYSSCVRDVTKRSKLVFLSLLDLLLYFISLVLESLGFLGASWSILNTRVRVSSLGDLEIRVLR
jgi:hypothetical protein